MYKTTAGGRHVKEWKKNASYVLYKLEKSGLLEIFPIGFEIFSSIFVGSGTHETSGVPFSSDVIDHRRKRRQCSG